MPCPDDCTCEDTLRNLAALVRYANPRRLPPYPAHRRRRLIQLAWAGLRIPGQRPWPEP